MLSKRSRVFCILSMFVFIILIYNACDYQGSLKENKSPTVKITSFSGREFSNVDTLAVGYIDSLAVEVLDPDAVAYQQKIFWLGQSQTSVIKGYAFRITDKNGNAVSVPGYELVSDNTNTPQALLAAYGAGWYLHNNKTQGDTSISVWSDQVFAEISFPCNDGSNGLTGELIKRISKFEVVCIDSRGWLSNKEERWFHTRSNLPTVRVSSSTGEFSSTADYGLGIKVFFKMDAASDGAQVPRPWYFRYKLYQENLDGTLKTDPASVRWYDTRTEDKISELVLTAQGVQGIKPRLITDYPDTDANTLNTSLTVLVARAVDMAGVESDSVVVKFKVSDRYTPRTRIYTKNTYALSDYHYNHNQDIFIQNDFQPSIIKNRMERIATGFSATPVVNRGEVTDYKLKVVGDEQTRIYFRWGYSGEYGGNDTESRYDGYTINEEKVYVKVGTDTLFSHYSTNTGDHKNYNNEITYFHIQLDGVAYDFKQLDNIQPPHNWWVIDGKSTWDEIFPNDYLDGEKEFLKEPVNGKWPFMRVPVNNELAQRLFRNGNLALNVEHTLVVAAEDLQGRIDPYPAIFNFEIIKHKTPSERSGVFYAIPQSNTNVSIVEGAVKGFYIDGNVIPDMNYATRITLTEALSSPTYRNLNEYGGISMRNVFPNTLLQDYKMVFYSAELWNTSNVSFANINNDLIGLQHYVRNGGILVISGHRSLHNNAPSSEESQRSLGFPLRETIRYMKDNESNTQMNFLTSIVSDDKSLFPDLYPDLISQVDATTIGPRIINTEAFPEPVKFLSFSPTAYTPYYFTALTNPSNFITSIYKYNCRAVGDIIVGKEGDTFENGDGRRMYPSAEEFDERNGVTIAYRYDASKIADKTSKSYQEGKVYVFGFSLINADKSAVKTLIDNIMTK